MFNFVTDGVRVETFSNDKERSVIKHNRNDIVA